MAICTFFGHKTTPQEIEPYLQATLFDLIKNKNVTSFYVGNHGNFDYLVRKNLKSLKLKYPQIEYAVVLAYMPSKKSERDFMDYSDTIYPCGLECTPPKYAIIKRNKWMLDKADYVITYVTTTNVGGAAQFKSLAEKKGKTVINLATDQ